MVLYTEIRTLGNGIQYKLELSKNQLLKNSPIKYWANCKAIINKAHPDYSLQTGNIDLNSSMSECIFEDNTQTLPDELCQNICMITLDVWKIAFDVRMNNYFNEIKNFRNQTA